MRLLNRLSCFALAAVAAAFTNLRANADFEVHFEGFEDPAWVSGGDNWNDYTGSVMRVTSGTNGITSANGAAHAIVGAPGANASFTRFGGYGIDFNGGYTTSLDIYLDPSAIIDGVGFDYSVAANGSDGFHLRDFMFHVGSVSGDLLVNASNNTDGAFNAFKLQNENGGDNYTVASAGWYTFEHVFYDNGSDQLAVDLNLYNDGGSLLYSITRSSAADVVSTVVGGNRYGWFTYNTVSDLAIDNTRLAYAIPEPTSALACFGLIGAGLFVRRRKK